MPIATQLSLTENASSRSSSFCSVMSYLHFQSIMLRGSRPVIVVRYNVVSAVGRPRPNHRKNMTRSCTYNEKLYSSLVMRTDWIMLPICMYYIVNWEIEEVFLRPPKLVWHSINYASYILLQVQVVSGLWHAYSPRSSAFAVAAEYGVVEGAK